MKTISSFLTIAFLFGNGYAQYPFPFEKVDTVTNGDNSATSPVLMHGSYHYSGSDSIQWLLFEQRTALTSVIAAKKYYIQKLEWDTGSITISTTAIDTLQRNPEICALSYWGDYNRFGHGPYIAAWERKEGNVWRLYYSRLGRDDSIWSSVQPLTNDSVSTTNIQIRLMKDSTCFAFWKRQHQILYSIITPHAISEAETIAVSSSDAFTYDVVSTYDRARIVWTSQDSGGKTIMILRDLKIYPTLTISAPETLFFRADAFNPKLMNPLFLGKIVFFEADIDSNREVLVWQENGPNNHLVENISNDANADDRNPSVFMNPIITMQNSGGPQSLFSYYDIFTMEKYTRFDSALVFSRGWSGSDTVRSAGYNRNACIGTNMFYSQNDLRVLTVWESNRSGKSHIYARTTLIPSMGVEDDKKNSPSFTLNQNYPNPFNPTTTISFTLHTSAFITLKVYDLLGRVVATLVHEQLKGGTHVRLWNAGNIASGIYFYRLQMDQHSATKKLMLLK